MRKNCENGKNTFTYINDLLFELAESRFRWIRFNSKESRTDRLIRLASRFEATLRFVGINLLNLNQCRKAKTAFGQTTKLHNNGFMFYLNGFSVHQACVNRSSIESEMDDLRARSRSFATTPMRR
ncbi:hypothetical protein AVEN_41808-1 [Araneus ventricosus]|uniref:Uncharacterized protein n=1 Tax=Araneus ventricosus TaxID=182803 RepID=A0A4Y2ADS8_ARAVE|nr:hypothetical protein AVEN_41808-1 [Araneus ventricosus]